MADYDFSTLSPIDFERLVNDLVHAVEGVRVERFGVGRDAGIDGRFAAFTGNGIVQAKHYRASTFSQLKTSLLKSKDQILGHKPARYIVCTSQNLSPTRKDELVAALQPIAVTESDIWCREDLNAALTQHSTVERAHIKLWLNSSGVLERFVNGETYNRSEAFLSELQRATALFVAHEGYERAQQVIDVQAVLVIAGPPGVGKTTLALVLAARYLEDNWELFAVNSISEALKAFSSSLKQVFIFDDFLGAIKLDKDALSRSDSDFRRFVELVRRNPHNTRFILTTRKYIYEEARIASETLSDKSMRMSDIVLELSSYTNQIRGEILYNHLFFSKLSEEHISALVRSGKLGQIIRHENYMPRIIQWLTDDFRLSGCNPADYPTHFLATLDRPHEIWAHAVQEHLDQAARTLLRCLFFGTYSEGLSRRLVDWFAAVNIRLAERHNVQVSERELPRAIQVLEGSFIQLVGRRVSFVNPSLRDYLNADLRNATTLLPLAECVQDRWQALQVWRFVKSEKDKLTGPSRLVYRALADNCFVEGLNVVGSVSFYDFLNFAKAISEELGEENYCDLLVGDEYLNSLELDIPEIIKMLEENHSNIYRLQDPDEFRLELGRRLISSLKQAPFDIEEGVAVLETADQHFKFLDEQEVEALREMADAIFDGISLPPAGEDEDEWIGLEEALEVLENWLPGRNVWYLKMEVDEQLTAFEGMRQALEDQARDGYALYGRGSGGGSNPAAASPSAGQPGEGNYLEVFESLLSSEN